MKKIFIYSMSFCFLLVFSPSFLKAQCNAAFTANSVCAGSSITFTDGSSVTAPDSIVKEIWTYGYGLTDTLYTRFNTTHTHFYPNGGAYPVTLTIYTSAGCNSTFSSTALVKTAPPVADSFTYSQTPCVKGSYNILFALNNKGFIGTPSDNWVFGDGVKITGAADSIIHTYANPGSYSVQLISRTSGCSVSRTDTAIKIVNVYGPPLANFEYKQDTGSAKKILFNDLAYGGQSTVSNWYWDFGDGNISAQQNPSHAYTTAGTYTVKHTVTTMLGCISDTVSLQVYVDANYIPTTSLYQSNFGNDFWAGFGYEERMSQKTSAGGAKMEFYIVGGDKPSIVTISLPGIPAAVGFPQVVAVPANGEVTISGFPQGDPYDAFNAGNLPDTRLYYTGTSNKGIHISASQPIAVWQHIFAMNNSAGATLLIPTSIWDNNYTVQTIGGLTNTGTPNSFFYVIAQQDNTVINFTPSNDIVDSSSNTLFTLLTPSTDILYHAGSPYSITLNKGQIFNAMGFIPNYNTGVDLSATTVSSADPTKKIAVFGGNGRVIINTAACNSVSGSDNLIQQMFPQIAWGTKYLTVPTKTMEYNIYRITVADSTTIVSVNGNILPTSSLIKNSYYQIEGNAPNAIASNKKIMVTQYITTSGCPSASLGNNGSGDPEMIILSPIAQASNSLTLYSASFANASLGGSYINVVIKKAGINSFMLDGMNTADTGSSSFTGAAYGSAGTIPMANAFVAHPGDTSYYYAKLKVAYPALHTLSSDSSFSAIVYGVAGGESYGYNGGFTLNYQHIVYTFTGTGNWNNPSNWANNTIPPADLLIGSEIVISGNCTLNVPQTLETGATLTVLAGAHLTVFNNLLIQK